VTSIGVHQSAIWLHDERGERSLSSEGEVVEFYSPPTFTPDGKTLYYLYRHQPVGGDPELWKMEVDSGKSEAVFQGIAMIAYDVSPDGKLVVYAAGTSDGQTQLWLAPIDKSTPPRPVGPPGSNMPHFGPGEEILFQYSEGNANYLEKMNRDGGGRSKIMTTPVIDIQAVSPGRKWVMALVAFPEGKGAVPVPLAIPLDGGPMRRMCVGYCKPVWSPNGKFLVIPVEPSSQTNSGRSLAISVGREESLPPLPTAGVSSSIDAHTVPGSQWIDREALVPGIDPSHYAYIKTTSHRNLYQLSLP
jgi:WD40 repeat protein